MSSAMTLIAIELTMTPGELERRSVEESYIPDDPRSALREFLKFIVQQLEDAEE